MKAEASRPHSKKRLGALLGIAAFLDEVPKVLVVGESFVFGRNLRAVEEVGEGAFVKDAMDDDFVVVDFEVEAPVVSPKAVEGLAIANQFAEFLVIKVFEILRGDLELVKNLELGKGVELRNLGGGDFVEDDLEHGGEWHEGGRVVNVDGGYRRDRLERGMIETWLKTR